MLQINTSNICSVFSGTTAALLLGVMLMSAAGCNEPINKPKPLVVYSDDMQVLPKQPSYGVVPETQAPLIPDAPQPVGFKALADVCTVEVMPSGARKVYHLYQGRGQIDDVQRMYRRHLPNHGWKMIGEIDDPDMTEAALTFEKGVEVLYVRLRQDSNKITLILEITPKA